MKSLIVNMFDTPSTFLGIREIMMWQSFKMYPTNAVAVENPLRLSTDNIIDRDQESYWMGPIDHRIGVTILIDVGQFYNVSMMEVYWAFRPVNYEIWWTGLDNPNFVRTSDEDAWKREWSTTKSGMHPYIRNLEIIRALAGLRYFTIIVSTGYRDNEKTIGTAIRNIAIYNDVNIARGLIASASSTWDYPTSALVDNNPESYWAAQWGKDQAFVTFTLNELTNIAGVKVDFVYLANRVAIAYSAELEGEDDWVTILNIVGNEKYQIEVPSYEVHFRARRLRLSILEAGEKIPDPDDWLNDNSKLYQIGVSEFQLLKHTGGGGVFGVESLDGTEYDSVVYAQSEPRQWMSGSEGDHRTADVWGTEEVVGSMAHVVVAYGKDKITLYRNGLEYGTGSYPANLTKMENGTSRLVFGVRSTAYVPNQTNSMNFTSNPSLVKLATRLVALTNDAPRREALVVPCPDPPKEGWVAFLSELFQIAPDDQETTLAPLSTAFMDLLMNNDNIEWNEVPGWNDNVDKKRFLDLRVFLNKDPEGENILLPESHEFLGRHALTHSPFFSGTVHMATLIRGELLAEEVRGLYEDFLGGKERGCHCYDACPTAPSDFHPHVEVPCGGHGICLRNPRGVPFGKGVCECLPGYAGAACQRHCTVSGCCKTDDDCLPSLVCETMETSSCMTPEERDMKMAALR
jgi:hypothetical protein